MTLSGQKKPPDGSGSGSNRDQIGVSPTRQKLLPSKTCPDLRVVSLHFHQSFGSSVTVVNADEGGVGGENPEQKTLVRKLHKG